MKTYKQALEYLYSFIPKKQYLHTGENGILRTKYLLKLLNSPQEKLKVIHIAGTSGKGSTAYLTSHLLSVHGFKVGFQISPHLIDLRERFQINSKLIPRELFAKYLNEILPFIEKVKETKWGKLTFFEIGVCLAFYIFFKEKVNYAIMETGLGGLFDGTNVVKNPKKLCVITKIGFDHQSVLGHTLSDIASQKAGIIQTGNTTITAQQKPSVMKVFYSRCNVKKSPLFVIKKGVNFQTISISKSGTVFDFNIDNYSFRNLKLGLIGKHQVENASLALTSICELSKRDNFKMSKSKIKLSLQSARFPGRCEIYSTKYRDIIIDGAHNPQKMKAFISTIKKLYPNQRFDFLISFSEGKNHIPVIRGMLKQIITIAQTIIITPFTLEGGDMSHTSISASRIIKVLKELHYQNYSVRSVDKNFIQALINKEGKPLVITGSLYLIGSIYTDLKHAIMHSL